MTRLTMTRLTTTRLTTTRLTTRTARAAVAAIVVLDLLALVALSVHRTTTTTQSVRPAANQPVVRQTGAVTPTGSPTGDGGELVRAPTVEQPAVTVTTHITTHPAPPITPPTPSSPTVAACPIALKEPASNGGLQSLIDFAPAFGPFSAEAFAAASAYQPLLQLVGPILAQYPTLAPKLAPLMNTLLAPWETLLNTGFASIAPLYVPHRQAVLEAESKLAAFFAPYAQKLATSSLGGCVIDLEAALVAATHPESTLAKAG